MTILQKIKKLCKGRKTNISNLEKALGLGNGVIGRWDKSSPHVDSLKKVADYFGITVDELLPDDEPEPKPGHDGRTWNPTDPGMFENKNKEAGTWWSPTKKDENLGPKMYEEVRKAAKVKGYTLRGLENKAGIAPGTISHWKNGCVPSTKSLQKIAHILCITLDITGTNGCIKLKPEERAYLENDISATHDISTAMWFGWEEDEGWEDSTIGDRIRQKRIEAGYSQDELASLMGYASRSSISKLESNKRTLPSYQIEMLAAILHTTPAYIMGWEEPEPMADDNTIYGRMRRLAEEKGIDLQKMEEELQLGSGVMTRWKHRAEPNTKVLRKIADYLGVSLDYLIAGKEQKSSDEKLEKLLGELAGIISQIKEVL